MITYQYTQKDWTTFKEGIKREWAVTNGIGGYAGSSMIGAHSRIFSLSLSYRMFW